MTTFDELMRKALTLFPNAYVSENISGELVIETGYELGPNDTLVPVKEDETD